MTLTDKISDVEGLTFKLLRKYSYSKFLNLSNRSCSQLEHYEDTIRELNLKMTSLQGDRDQREHEVRIVSRHRLME